MILFSDFTKFAPQSYILVSTMVRYAQEMGLHRRDSLIGLSDHEAMKRRQLWMCIFIFDRDCCFKFGKPPIINLNEVSSVTPDQYKDVIFHGLDPYTVESLTDVAFDITGTMKDMTNLEYQESPVRHLLVYYYFSIVDITSSAYDTLFSARSFQGMPMDQVLEAIDRCDKELEEVTKKLPESMRPGNSFTRITALPVKYDFWGAELQYYASRMMITKMAFTRTCTNNGEASEQWHELKPLQRRLMTRCLDAARMIMRSVHGDVPANPLFSNCASFQFMSAFLTLFNGIIEFPNAPFVKEDLELITVLRKKLFAEHKTHCDNAGENFLFSIINYSVWFFMRIAVLVYNRTHQDRMDVVLLDNELRFFESEIAKQSLGYAASLKRSDPIGDILKNSGLHFIGQTEPKPVHQVTSLPGWVNSLLDTTEGTSVSLPRTAGNNPASPLPGFGSLGGDEFNIEDFDMEKSWILEQVFGIPSLFLNTNEQEDHGDPLNF